MNKLFHCKFFQIAILFLLAELPLQAQYGNEWINFNQQYFKVTVAADGAYRLSHSDLLNAGFPVSTVDPRRIQLFHRGVEQAIIVQGQADAKFDPADFIEFYGVRNDGTLDAKLYSPSSLQPHPYYNLYTDTSSYFLTWTQSVVQGKRMSNFSEINVSGIPKEPHHNNQQLELLHNEYATGNTINSVLQYSQFDEGEGWTGSTICIGNSGCTGQADYTINGLGGGITSAANPQLELLLVGRDALNHLSEVHVGPNSGSLRLLTTQSFVNYQTVKVLLPLLWSDIGPTGQLTVRVKALGVGGLRDRLSVSYIKVVHPQDFNMNAQVQKCFLLQLNPSGKSYIEIINPPAGLSLWDITDPASVGAIGVTPQGALQTAVVPNTGMARKLFAKSTFSTPVVKSVSFRQINPSSANYLVISNPALMKPALNYNDPVKAYAGYRASANGGGYDTLVVTADQLYNQFNFGEPSALAIYQFMKFMVDNGDPRYLFIIGKGLDVSQGFHRKTIVGPNDFKDLVPSAGMPGSDAAFTAGLKNTTFEPYVPTGRISASTPVQVASYLNKILEMEGLPFDDLWRKEVLHLSGGIQPNELIVFRQFMDQFGEAAQAPYYGGNVTTIGKQEASPVELINVSDEVNKGVNLVTFFGHSSPNTIDIDIGFVTDPVLGYNNPGKYPAFLINGCNAGFFFSNFTVFGEDWILANEKGARNFIAHSSFGFTSTLRAYSQLFYETGFGDSTLVQAGIGDVQKEVGSKYLASNPANIATVTQVQQMVLLGDPAVKLFGAPKPDYETSNTALFLEAFNDEPITALTDSFAIKIIARNFGSVEKEPLGVRVTRTFNDNSFLTYDSLFPFLNSLDTITFVIKKEEGTSGFGNNQFLVQLDYADSIAELNEDNNQAQLNLFIPLSGTKNLFPLQNGVVSQQQIKLLWQNTDLRSGNRLYQLELDTLPSFDSPFKQQFEISGKVLLEHNVTLLGSDSIAYYWRTRLADPLPGENEAWTVSALVYINDGPEGWAQVHFPQYQENNVKGLVKDDQLRELKFEETETNIFVNNFGSNHISPSTTSFKINNVEYNLATQGQPCRNNTINLVAFDKTTLVPYAGIPFIFQDPRTCGRSPQVINSFTLAEMETGAGNDIIQYIDNLNISDSVVIFSIGDAGYPLWSTSLKTKMNELGIAASQIEALVQGEPIVLFGKKGGIPGTALIEKSATLPANEQELQVAKALTGKFTSGTMTSQLIGPAQSWQRFVSMVEKVEGADQFFFDVKGIGLTGNENLLLTNITGTEDISGFSAAEYPFLKIILHTTDEVNQSPVQLNQWIVEYTPVAEGILLFDDSDSVKIVGEGTLQEVVYAFKNISTKFFPDSLLVTFDIFNKPQRINENKTIHIAPPAPGDSVRFSFVVNSKSKIGLNDVNVFVNPKILPEQYYENNVLELLNFLNVEGDAFSPVLDVAIDGRHIVDGDFVSPNPFIEILMWDENKLVIKEDTLGIKIFLKSPCVGNSCNFVPVSLSSEEIQWFAATKDSNFRIDYRPRDLGAGEYTLRITVEDASGNGSDIPYQVRFVVDTDERVQFANPYPNPSQQQIFFDFLVVGDNAVDGYSLQIMTLNGKIIYDSTADKNTLHIGTNQQVWDGKDAGGILQREGLYIYRQQVSIGSRQYVKHGKIVLIR